MREDRVKEESSPLVLDVGQEEEGGEEATNETPKMCPVGHIPSPALQ